MSVVSNVTFIYYERAVTCNGRQVLTKVCQNDKGSCNEKGFVKHGHWTKSCIEKVNFTWEMGVKWIVPTAK